MLTTEGELIVLAGLGRAWNAFARLPDEDPTADEEFRTIVNRARELIILRGLKRAGGGPVDATLLPAPFERTPPRQLPAP